MRPTLYGKNALQLEHYQFLKHKKIHMEKDTYIFSDINFGFLVLVLAEKDFLKREPTYGCWF